MRRLRFTQTLFGILAVTTATLVLAQQTPQLMIRGAPEALEKNIQALLSLENESCEIDDIRLQRQLRNYDKNIQLAAQALGYYHASVEKTIIRKDGCWQLTLKVNSGPPIIIKNVDIQIEGQGSSDKEFQLLLTKHSKKVGTRLDHSDYEKIKTELNTLAIERGYIDAQFSKTVLSINTQSNSADISIIYITGERYRFGSINIHQEILSDNFINRYLPFATDTLYSGNKLLELQKRLSNSQYFESITIQPQQNKSADQHTDIDIYLTPRKQHAYIVGLGATTDTKLRLKLGYENRYINSDGHKLNIDSAWSPVRSELNTSYFIPLKNPSIDQFRLLAGYQDEETVTVVSNTQTLGMSYSTVMSNYVLRTIAINFQRDDFTIADVREKSNSLIPSFGFSRIKADNPLYPLRGWRANAQIRGASDKFASDISFAQITLQAKYIHHVNPGRIILRGEVGSTEVDDITVLPTTLRFFAGGDNSVRGFDYQSLGPTDIDDNVIGGRKLLIGNIEYDYRFHKEWAVAVFLDTGDAYDGTVKRFKQGAGIGIRWLSPIGPVRLDFAKPLDSENSLQVHLSMGPDL